MSVKYTDEQVKNLAHRAAQMLLGSPYATDHSAEVSMFQSGSVTVALRSVEGDYVCLVPRYVWIKEITS